MSRRIIYKLPVVEKTLVLESKIPPEVIDFNKDEDDEVAKQKEQKELLETVTRESYQKGWDEGVKKVQDETQNNIELMCQGLQKAIDDLKQERNTIWDKCEKEIVKLVLVTAKEVIDFNKDEDDEVAKQKEQKELLETVTRESYQKGWDEGVKKVQDETKKNIELMCQGLQKAIDDLKQERNTIWDKCEKEIVKLVLVTAKEVICHEISKGGSKVVEEVVAGAVNKVKGKKILRLHLNPVDIEDFKRRKIAEFTNGNKDYEIVSDTDITSGGCKVVTDYGSVDARLETRWGEIEAAFGGHKLETDQDK